MSHAETSRSAARRSGFVTTNPVFPEFDRCLIDGVAVDRVGMADAVEAAGRAIDGGRQISIFAVNPEKVVRARREPLLKALLTASELLIPDGIGVVVAMRLRGLAAERVPGSELMPALCAQAARSGWPVFLLGGKPEVNAVAAERLLQRFPELSIAGRQHGYFTEEQTPELIARINESGARLLFVAMGSPKQEQWISDHRALLGVSVMQGVGGTFDVIAGTVQRAPALWLKLNLEWLYRLLAQPSRLLRQRALPIFALRTARQWLGELGRRP